MFRRLALPLTLTAAVAATLALSSCSAGGLPVSASTGSSTGASSTSGSNSGSNSGSGSGSNSGSGTATVGTLPAHCPSAETMTGILGSPAPAPNENREAKLLTCIYVSGSNVAAILVYEPMPAGVTLDEMKALTQKKTDQPLTSFSGVGDGGFVGSGTDGQTIVYLLKDNLQIALSSKQSASQLEQEAGQVPTS